MISAGDSWLPRAVHASKETCSQKTDPPYNSLKQNATLNRRSCNCLGRRTAILRSTINSQRAVRTYVRMQPSIHPFMHACIPTRTCIHTYIHTHLLTYIHTHTRPCREPCYNTTPHMSFLYSAANARQLQFLPRHSLNSSFTFCPVLADVSCSTAALQHSQSRRLIDLIRYRHGFARALELSIRPCK